MILIWDENKAGFILINDDYTMKYLEKDEFEFIRSVNLEEGDCDGCYCRYKRTTNDNQESA